MSKLIVLALLILPLHLLAASFPQRYEAARRSALRDSKVRGAYAEYERALAAKIAQIDPGLKGWTPGKPIPKATPAPKPAVKPKPKATPKPVVKAKPTPAPKPVVKSKPKATPKPAVKPKPTPKPTPLPKIPGTKHKVAQGETFESIAVRYRVGVPTLRQANPGVHERRLQVGQVIVVPKKNTAPPVSQGIPYQKKQS